MTHQNHLTEEDADFRWHPLLKLTQLGEIKHELEASISS